MSTPQPRRPDVPERSAPGPGRRSALVRVLSGLGVLGMASPLVWVAALAVLWVVARDALNGGLVFYVFGSTLLAMVVGVLLFAWADRLDQRRLQQDGGARADDGEQPGRLRSKTTCY